MAKRLLLIAVALGFTSCQQDPYKGETPPSGLPPKKVEGPKGDPGANSLQIPLLMEFYEGKNTDYIIKASVEGSGEPLVKFFDLPAGVTWDLEKQKLSWTPDYTAANDPLDPSIRHRNYNVTVELYSSEDPVRVLLKEQVMLTVNDVPRPASIKSDLDVEGAEGQELTHVIEFEDLEYPAGPFQIAVSGLPMDAQLIWPNKTIPRFTLKWTPDYTDVKNITRFIFTGQVTIYNPRGKALSFGVRWAIEDKIQPPVTTGPKSVIQGSGDLDFLLIAEDINGEANPEWKVKKAPPYGIFATTDQPIQGPGLPKTTGIVTWKAIPKDKLGIPVSAELEACVRYYHCTTHTVQLLPLNTPSNAGATR